MMECAARGLDVPRDVSVVGYGDLDIAAAMNPGLTTVRTPADQMGRIAAECLVAKLSGGTGIDRVELATEFIVRGSTGPATPPRGVAQ